MIIDNVLIRLDAGGKFGLGHLSRCISLIHGFQCNSNRFLVKTDNRSLVESYLKDNIHVSFELLILDLEASVQEEIEFIARYYSTTSLLIVDHYNATEKYQRQLLARRIAWLQLDSHAKINFYANWVMHGSPGATDSLYEPLRKNPASCFLLGPKYCIIKEPLLLNYSQRRVREDLKKVLVCFGGGNDNGATLRCLKSLDFEGLGDIEFNVVIGRFNPDYKDIQEFQNKGLIRIIEPNKLLDVMIRSDLALIAPGMMSYESAFLGLPMLLVTIADNQIINAKAWESNGCALNIGSISEITENINTRIVRCKYSLKEMSQNCLTLVDGKGGERSVKEINR